MNTVCVNTDTLGALPLEDALDVVAGLGIEAVEIAAGGNSAAPHLRIGELLADKGARDRLAAAISSRGLRLAAINASSDPLHPQHGAEHQALIKDALRLAGELGVERIVTMSGCPGDSPQARVANWIWFPWPEEMLAVREEQWQRAIELWVELAELASQQGVAKFALELHPLHLVYNVPTLLRLREAAGPVVGANVDPSHLFWQQMDPARVVAALGPAVHHVHLKDTELFGEELAVNGVLDPRDWDDPEHRSWVFRAMGKGQPAAVWEAFLGALEQVGYGGVLSIENEDPSLPGEPGVREALSFLGSLSVDAPAVAS